MTDVATIHTVDHGDPSEMPEVNWFWRRVFVFALTLASCALVWRISERVTDVAMLREIARNSQAIIALCVFVYVAGASATDTVRLVTALRSSRREVITTGTPPATLTSTSTAAGSTSSVSTDADDPTQFGGPRP